MSPNKSPRIAVLTRVGYSYHGKVLWGFLNKVEEIMGLKWRPVLFFCKEPRQEVMIEQMHEIKNNGSYDLIISIGALYSLVAKEFIKEHNWDIPLLFGGITDPVELGILNDYECEKGITGILREQVPATYIADFLMMLKPTMKKVLIPHYPNSEQGLLIRRLNMVVSHLADHDIESILLPVNNMREVNAAVAEAIPHVDTMIISEGTFVGELTSSFIEMANRYQVTLVSHSLDAAHSGAAITFAQDIGLIGEYLFTQAQYILEDCKKPIDVPLLTVPDQRKILINKAACEKQGLIYNPAILFCLNKSIILE